MPSTTTQSKVKFHQVEEEILDPNNVAD